MLWGLSRVSWHLPTTLKLPGWEPDPLPAHPSKRGGVSAFICCPNHHPLRLDARGLVASAALTGSNRLGLASGTWYNVTRLGDRSGGFSFYDSRSPRCNSSCFFPCLRAGVCVSERRIDAVLGVLCVPSEGLS